MNKEENIKKIIQNLQNKLSEKKEYYNEMSYTFAIRKIADSIIPFKKNEFANLPSIKFEF